LRLLARFVVAATIALAHAATAEPIRVGFTATGDYFPLFIAKEEGYFAKRGLDVEPVLVPINSIIPQALLANSLEIGGPRHRCSCRPSMAASIWWRSPATR
jgi:NitT/TauT family transport system substrate-binding protein